MKIKIIIISILICLVLLTGCINQDNQNGDNNANDNSNDDNIVTAGWYLKEIVDYDEPYTGDSAAQYGITYSRGNVTTNHYSADGLYELTVRTIWDAPPEYFGAEEQISIPVTKEVIVLNLLLLGYYDITAITIDDSGVEPGVGTESAYDFTDATHGKELIVGQGDTPDTVKTATFVGNAPKSDGPYGEQFGLIIKIQNQESYGIKYIYEWRE
jgi:hypothetical protein